jgi:hypothetical protein
MAETLQPFYISLYGVTTKVTPVLSGLSMQYVVSLPTWDAQIEMIAANDMQGHWIEVERGKTELAEIVGQEIEQRED